MYSHDLVAAIKKLDGSTFADGIGRYFSDEVDSKGNPLYYFRMDIWPIAWTGEAFLVDRFQWRKGAELPVVEPDSPLEFSGSMSIVCESFTLKNGTPKNIGRSVGDVFKGFTKQHGQILIARFHAVPANPHYYNNGGTVRVFFKEQSRVAA